MIQVQVGPAKRMPLTLLRHGESNWNALHLVQGQNDEARLSARGVEQARVVAGEWDRHSFDAIVSSNLVRAFETSQIIADALGIEVTTNALLRERSFGDFEGSPLSELPSSLSGFADGHVIDDGARPPGESPYVISGAVARTWSSSCDPSGRMNACCSSLMAGPSARFAPTAPVRRCAT